jgi:hypothetical protein
MKTPTFLTTEQVAKLLNNSTYRVKKAVKDGDLHNIAGPGKWLFAEEEVQIFLYKLAGKKYPGAPQGMPEEEKVKIAVQALNFYACGEHIEWTDAERQSGLWTSIETTDLGKISVEIGGIAKKALAEICK